MESSDVSVEDELAKQLQAVICNKDVTPLQDILETNKIPAGNVIECAKLKSHQARTFSYSDEAVNVLHYAAYVGNLDVFTLLLNHGFETKLRTTRTKWAALHFAAFGGHIDIVKLLVLLGCDVNIYPTKHGASPLHLAIGFPEIVKFLLQKGSNVEALCRVPANNGLIKANNFLTPLGFGIDSRAVESVKILLDSGVDFDHVCEVRNMDTPLKYIITAMLSNDSGIERFKAIFDLLVAKAIELQRVPKLKALLHSLAPCYDPDIISHTIPRLIDCGVKLESRNRAKNTPLLEAIEKCNAVCVKELLRENCSLVHVSSSSGRRNHLDMFSGSVHPKHPVELCVYVCNVETVKLKMYFGPNARPSLYVEVDLVGNVISLVGVLEMLLVAGGDVRPSQSGITEWSQAVDEVCTHRINYFNHNPFWREHTARCVEMAHAPRGLQDMCRRVIREKYRGRRLHAFITTTGLPTRVADFLQLKAEINDPCLLVNKPV